MPRRLGRFLRARVYGHRSYEPLFRLLHRYAVSGLYGVGEGFAGTGEARLLAQLARKLPAEPVVVDAGANVGRYARLVLQTMPSASVHCFEPSAAAYASLERELGRDPRSHLYRVALGDEERSATLHSSGLPGDNLASLHPGRQGGEAAETVQVRRLDEAAAAAGLTRVDFLKVDTEGHDLFVLRGAGSLLDSLHAVQFEFGEANVASRTFLRDFYDLLEPRFELFRVLRDGLVSLGPYRETLEVFVSANYLAVARDAAVLRAVSS